MKLSNHKMDFALFQDWKVNRGSLKGQIVMVLFRLAKLVKSNIIFNVLFFWYLLLYRFFIEWILNIGIHWNVKAGRGLKLNRGYGSVISGDTVIGENCTIRHFTTITNKVAEDGSSGKSPKIGNNVDIGVNVVIIGDVVIGDNVTIGAGTVVTKSIEANSVMVGNPARLLKKVYDQHSFA